MTLQTESHLFYPKQAICMCAFIYKYTDYNEKKYVVFQPWRHWALWRYMAGSSREPFLLFNFTESFLMLYISGGGGNYDLTDVGERLSNDVSGSGFSSWVKDISCILCNNSVRLENVFHWNKTRSQILDIGIKVIVISCSIGFCTALMISVCPIGSQLASSEKFSTMPHVQHGGSRVRSFEVVVYEETVAGWLLGDPEESCLAWQELAFSFLIEPIAFSTFFGPTQLTAFFSLL